MQNKVLIHACCAICLGYPHQRLTQDGYDVSVLFYNPNIYPQSEYKQRLDEVIRFCSVTKTPLFIIEDNEQVYYDFVNGLEHEQEKGLRCEKCFELRLNKTAEFAKNNNFDFFTTTLSVSPHKNFNQIKSVAENVANNYNIKYLAYDFKKQNGFKITNEIANSYGFYRQNYCGCKFSIRKED